MSFIFDRDLGEVRDAAKALSVPQTFRAPFKFNAATSGGSRLSFDPTSSTEGGVSITTAPGITNTLNLSKNENRKALGRFDGFRSSLDANENPFIQARVRPTQERVNQNVAAVARGNSLRGVSGSLANNEVNNAQIAGSREIADQTALATRENLAAKLEVEAGRLGIGDETLAIAGQELEIEMNAINAMLDSIKTGLANQQQLTTQLGGNVLNEGDSLSDDITNSSNFIADIIDFLNLANSP